MTEEPSDDNVERFLSVFPSSQMEIDLSVYTEFYPLQEKYSRYQSQHTKIYKYPSCHVSPQREENFVENAEPSEKKIKL